MPSEQHQMIVQMLRNRPDVSGAEVGIEELRKGMELLSELAPLPDGAKIEPVEADGRSCEWIETGEVARDAVLLYLHGGGYTMGSLDTHRGLVARLSEACGVRALSVAYRLAPEHPFPAAVDDAAAAYRWLLGRGIDARRIAIAGDSAGGGLTLATLVALRDSGDPLPGAGVGLSPWVDLEGSGESMEARAEADPMVDREGLLWMAGLYLDGADPRAPLASPLYADLKRLPPLLIQVGTAETLLDDSRRFAERAQAAGVELELQVFEELVHVFQAFAPIVPEAEEAIARIGAFVQARLLSA